jgi:phosphoribosylglycinamide formyltransferase 1
MMGQSKTQQIAVFASGSGTNFENLVHYFSGSEIIKVACLVVNKSEALAVERAKRLSIPFFIFEKKEDYTSGRVVEVLRQNNIDWVVLAGFLWLIPTALIHAYPHRIINIHPALLPKFGGKGMYGKKVHEAVKEAGEKNTGITIHLVNEKYDEGEILFQTSCEVSAEDSPVTIAEKVHELEYRHYPQVIEERIRKEGKIS